MALEFGGYDERDETPKPRSRAPEHKEKVDPYPLAIPTALTGLEVGKGEVLAYEAPLMSHDINKAGNVCTYNLRGLVSTKGASIDSDIVAKQFLNNLNAFLAANNVVDVQFGIGAGISTSILGTKHTREYIGRLTATFTLADPKKPGSNRITKAEGMSRYYVSSDKGNDKTIVVAAHQSNQAAFGGYKTIENVQEAGSQAALFAFGYKLTKATTPVVINTPPVITDQSIGTYETPQGKLTIGKQVDRFSHEGAVCLPLSLNGVSVGSLVKCEAKSNRRAQADFISAKASPQCFDKDPNGNQFPNPSKIVSYLGGKHPGKTIRVGMITTGPCFQSYQDPTVTGVALDGGVHVGHENSFVSGNSSSGKGVAYMIGGQMTIKHSGEAGFQIPSNATDVVTMSSLARIDRSNPSNPQYLINPNASLRRHDNAHAMVSFADGKRGELIINGCTPEQKQAVVSALMKNAGPYQIERALYADADAPTNFLDGIFVFDTKTNGLRYSHPNSGDLFRTPAMPSGDIVKNHMPGVMVYYAVQS